MYELIATDMDGTFLDGQGAYSKERLSKVLKVLQKHHIIFVAASGRPMLALKRLFQDFENEMFLVAENGCIVMDKEELVFEEHLTTAQYLEIIRLLEDNPFNHGYDYLLSGRNGAYIHLNATKEYEEYISQYYDNIQRISDFSILEDSIFNITANFSEGILNEANQWLNENIAYATAITSGFGILNIVIKGISKKIGLEKICERYAIQPENTLVFGDNLNDFEMFTFSGTKIAPENARPELKEVATEIIPSHEQESVMSYLEMLCARLESKK